MKSRFILITLLFSLFLSIGHDFILYEKSKNDSCVTMVQQTQTMVEDTCCNQVTDLHKSFHFLALLPSYETIQLENKSQLFSQTQLLSSDIYFSTFKPPRA